MHSFNRTVRNTFITPTKRHDFINAPIGWNEIEQSIKRSRETDGMVLSISQNQEFLKEEKDFLINEVLQQGIDGEVQQLREEKIGNEFVEIVRDFADLNTLEWGKTKAKCDFRDNNFDKKFRDNIKEKFELDRLTDINDNAIPSLTKKTYFHKKRKILLRSRLESTALDTQIDNLIDADFAPKLPVKYRSDENVFAVLDSFPIANATTTTTVGRVFYYNADRQRQFDIDWAMNVTLTPFNSYSVQIRRYENGIDLDYVNSTTLSSFTNPSPGSGGTYDLSGTTTISINEGESLMFSIFVDSGTYTVSFNSASLNITEDSLFSPTNNDDLKVDCITIKTAFERWFKILDGNVTFKSDFIDSNWANLILFSGKTLRHVVVLDPETEEETIPPIATVSFQYLFDTLFTIQPCAYGIEIEKGKIIFRIESIDYFFDDEEVINLGALNNIERSINKDRTYGTVVIGNKKSGENEEVYGLLATHTVNEFSLPAFKTDTKYEATTDARFDPNEIEMCFRKQYSDRPDEDTKYDNDHFFVDCFNAGIGGAYYFPYNWTNHFTSVDGVYDEDSAYNYRLSPMNCILRHGFNFVQEYTKPAYTGKKLQYKSSNGNVSMRTQLIGGTLYAENDNIPISVFGNPLITNLTIKGESSIDYELYKKINGVTNNKKNYYKTVIFINENGEEEKGFIQDLKIDNKIDVELTSKR